MRTRLALALVMCAGALAAAQVPSGAAGLVVIADPTWSSGTDDWYVTSNAKLSRVSESSGGYALQAKPKTTSGTKSVWTGTTSSSVMPVGTSVHIAARVRASQADKKLSLIVREVDADGSELRKMVTTQTPTSTAYTPINLTFATHHADSQIKVVFQADRLTARNYLRVREIETSARPPGTTPHVACAARDYSDPTQGVRVFNDDFTGKAVDTAKWRVRDDTYLDFDAAYIKSSNVTVHDGLLDIAGKKLASPVAVANGAVKKRSYSTGYLDTIDAAGYGNAAGKRFSQRYGRWEMRAKLPTNSSDTRGVWPAFWLRGDDTLGEIDVMESYGSPDSRATSFDPAASYEWTIWKDTTKASGKERVQGWAHDSAPAEKVWEDFHVYGVNWSPECLTFTLDDTVVGVVDADDVPWLNDALDSTFNIRLNMQIGSDYWGHPTAGNTRMPVHYLVDYVRAYAPL